MCPKLHCQQMSKQDWTPAVQIHSFILNFYATLTYVIQFYPKETYNLVEQVQVAHMKN